MSTPPPSMRDESPSQLDSLRPEPPSAQGPAADPEILRRLGDGDPRALAELMEAYWSPLLGYVTRMLGSADAAEDVVQDTFVRLWQGRARLTPRGSPRALVYQIARNLVFKIHRHHKMRSSKAPELRAFFRRSPKSPLDDVVDHELREVLEGAIRELPERRRDAFVLLRYQGLSLHEAAEVMEVSTQTVANHAALAMRQLRSALQRYQGP